MSTFILFWYLVCHEGVCERTSFEVSREAAAIIACESGNQVDLGSYDVYAKNSRSSASGLFQFIDSTYKDQAGRTNARTRTIGSFNLEDSRRAKRFHIDTQEYRNDSRP